MIKDATNTAARNQKSNLCEAYCKKFKFLCRSLTTLSYKQYFTYLTRQEFRVLLSYFRSTMESIPFDNNSDITPKSLRGQSIVFPIEMQVETSLKSMETVKEKVVACLEEFLKELHYKEKSLNTYFYNKKCRNNCKPQVKDVAMVKDEGLGQKDRIGIITQVNSNTVKMRFSNGFENTYPNSKVYLLCRPPKEIKMIDSVEHKELDD